MNLNMSTRFLLGGTALAFTGGGAQATTLLSSLATGANYYLVFETATTHDALSTDVATYNAFVNSQAIQASSIAPAGTWTALLSTTVTTAIANTNSTTVNSFFSVPVFDLLGVEVATSLASLIGNNSQPGIATQFGGTGSNWVWNGSNGSGVQEPGHTIGDSNPIFTGCGNQGQGYNQTGTSAMAIYAVSAEKTVGGGVVAVPEPASMSLFAIGTGVAIAARRKRNGAQGAKAKARKAA